MYWSGISVEHADGYRIYRSPIAGDSPGTEELVVEIGNQTSYTDTGSTTDTTKTPLPTGALGAWTTLPNMNSSREGACIVASQDPAHEGEYYLYVAGGRDETGTILDSIEFLPISITAEHDHSVGSWTANTLSLAVPRWQCGGYLVDSEVRSGDPNADSGTTIIPAMPMAMIQALSHTSTGGLIYVYFGSGLGSTGNTENVWKLVRYQPQDNSLFTGQTTTLMDIDSPLGSRAGYGYGAASGYLYAFGGYDGNYLGSSISSIMW